MIFTDLDSNNAKPRPTTGTGARVPANKNNLPDKKPGTNKTLETEQK